ncbi:hypothetical protein [Rhizobium sp. 2YAF20]|uniref:hypothetical protein n=1 Tax=Rhizobium sp. 2YAF20 TaxID=3233027 RepID=UPI003F9B73BF
MPVEEDPSLEACDDLQIVGTKFNIDEDCRNIAGAAGQEEEKAYRDKCTDITCEHRMLAHASRDFSRGGLAQLRDRHEQKECREDEPAQRCCPYCPKHQQAPTIDQQLSPESRSLKLNEIGSPGQFVSKTLSQDRLLTLCTFSDQF